MYTGLNLTRKPVQCFVKVMKDGMACFHLFRFLYSSKYRNEYQYTVGDTHNILLDNYAVHTNFLYTHTLSLEFAALASLCDARYKHN